MYRFVPTLKIRKRSVVVGAIWASLFWEAAKQGFGYYLNNFANFGKIYGTYALIVVVAFWIYYSSIVFILGGEIGKLFNERLEERIASNEKLKLKMAEETEELAILNAPVFVAEAEEAKVTKSDCDKSEAKVTKSGSDKSDKN
jgi:uncharacterized BrkB/YihY/UPF0761 family membrane protein